MKTLLVAIFVSSCSIMCESPAAQVPTEHLISDCEAACNRLQDLGCEEGEPDEDGASCLVICEETQAAGLVDLEPEKIAASESCPN